MDGGGMRVVRGRRGGGGAAVSICADPNKLQLLG